MLRFSLITSHPSDATAERQNEFDRCLEANLSNERIERIVVFAAATTPKISDPRLTYLPFEGQPTYADLFAHASKQLAGQACVVAHGDLIFDRSLGYFDDVDLSLTGLVFGGGGARPFRALAFCDALEGLGVGIPFGVQGSESRLARELSARLTLRDVRSEVQVEHRGRTSESSHPSEPRGSIARIPAATPKVWGIGLQRTGTSSFRRALNVLGISTLELAGAWFLVRLRDGKLVFEPHTNQSYFQGFADSPVPPFFREIDAMFPGSKFVLTTRQPERWLPSVETLFLAKRHWDRTAQGALYNALHERSYGVTEFNREACLAGYRKHVDEVLDYFRDRPDDLLVLDCAAPDKWPKLCAFLGRPVPEVPYPHVHRNTSRFVWALRRLLNWIPRPEALRAR